MLLAAAILAGCVHARLVMLGHDPDSWTLANIALEMTIARDKQGRIGMTHLQDRRTGYEWCVAGAPAPLFQVAFVRDGQRISLSGRAAFDLVRQRLTRMADGTQTLQLVLRSRTYPLELDLHWRLRPGVAPVEKWYSVTNRAPESVTIYRLGTFSQLVRSDEEQTVHYVQKGTAAAGTLRVQERPLAEGESEQIYCSAGDSRDYLDAVPWFLLDRGDGRGGMLYAWAFAGFGRFMVARAATSTVIVGGLQPEYFKHTLKPNETLRAPTGLFGAYDGAPDDAAREWHRFLRRYWLPTRSDPLFPRVHYNTWYSLGEDVDEASCLRELQVAADLGIEMFHLDAGWYRATGDWHPDPRRFPRGLRFLAQEAHRRGMQFGLWVGFTQISEAMLRQHPDWITTPGQQIDPKRPFSFRTLTICLGNPEARAWIRRELERIVRDYEVDLLEYDQPIIEDCRVPDHGHQAGDGSYAATLGFYELYDALRREFPNVLFENCMNGGHMMDFGTVGRTHFTSITDFRDPLHNRIALYGATFPVPPEACKTYMEDTPGVPAEYLFRSFMPGLWAISANLASWDEATRDLARRHIALYKRLRPLLCDADVYHVLPQADGHRWDGIEYYDRSRREGVLFVYRPNSREAKRRIRLEGVDDGAYQVRAEGQSTSVEVKGSALREKGVEVVLRERNSAALVYVYREAAGGSRTPVAANSSMPSFDSVVARTASGARSTAAPPNPIVTGAGKR